MHNDDIKQETKEMKICIVCHRQPVTTSMQRYAEESGRKDKLLKDIENLYRDNFNGKTI